MPGARGLTFFRRSPIIKDIEGRGRIQPWKYWNNPVSNHVYQKIGYRPLGDFAQLRFKEKT